MKGYKVFNPNWKCLGFQYEVGKSYEMDGLPTCCNRGFHFCEILANCFSYYDFDPKIKWLKLKPMEKLTKEFANVVQTK